MTAAERLLIDLRTLNIRVRVDGDLVRCKPPKRREIPSDLAQQIRDLKPQLIELLFIEQQEIDWRVETIGAGLLDNRTERTPGACSWCGAKMSDQQTGKCVSCCLAAARLVLARLDAASAGQTTDPHRAVSAMDAGSERDMTPERKEAA